jgi:hypothetical protein
MDLSQFTNYLAHAKPPVGLGASLRAVVGRQGQMGQRTTRVMDEGDKLRVGSCLLAPR